MDSLMGRQMKLTLLQAMILLPLRIQLLLRHRYVGFLLLLSAVDH